MILHSAVSGVYVVGSYKTFGQQQPQARVRRLPLPPRHFVARSMCTVSLSLVAARVGFLSLPRRLTLRNSRQRGGPILLGVDHRCRRLQEAVCDAHAPTGGDHAQVTATPSNAACARLPRPVRAPSSPPRSYTTLAKHRTTFLAATVLMLFCMGGNFAMFPAQARSRRISRRDLAARDRHALVGSRRRSRRGLAACISRMHLGAISARSPPLPRRADAPRVWRQRRFCLLVHVHRVRIGGTPRPDPRLASLRQGRLRARLPCARAALVCVDQPHRPTVVLDAPPLVRRKLLTRLPTSSLPSTRLLPTYRVASMDVAVRRGALIGRRRPGPAGVRRAPAGSR